jgi:hypothetical protein
MFDLVAKGVLQGGMQVWLQRKSCNLRHMKYMPSRMPRITVLALCFVIILIAAQFHFCADTTSQAASSHLCPLCAVAGLAIVTPLPGIALIPIADRLVSLPPAGGIASADSRPSSPRAPPLA